MTVRLLEIIDHATNGGAEKSTRLIAKEFKKLGLEVHMVYPDGPYAPEFDSLAKDGITTVRLPIRTGFFKSLLILKRYLKQHRITHIHSHQMKADLLVTLATICNKEIVKFSSVHCLIQDDITNPLKRFVYYYLSKFSYLRFLRIFTVSIDVAERFVSYYGLSSKQVVPIPNSISFEEIECDAVNQQQIRHDFNLQADTILLTCAGTLTKRKNQRVLIEALARIKANQSIKLILLGEGEEKDSLLKLSEKLHLTESVVFPGHRRDIYDWFAITDIYLQPSLHDPLPRALLEAMYLKIPCIASRLNSISEVITDRSTGLLVKPEPEALALAIQELLENDRLRMDFAAAGSLYVKNNCSMTVMAKRMLSTL